MNSNILEDLERTATRVPDRVAFCTDKESLTFAQLQGLAQAVGSHLCRTLPVRGIAAILMDGRALGCVPAFLGVAYAGCAYAPLDPAMPAERLAQILELMAPECILVDAKGQTAVGGLTTPLCPVISYEDAAGAAIDDEALAERRAQADVFDPLTILYTSGSTGVPKGSVQSHSSYIHYTEATIDIYGFDESVVFGNQSPFFYANSIIDIFPPIALGARVYLLPSNALAFPKRFLSCLREQRVTELTMTPSSFISLTQQLEPGCLPELKFGIMSGEAMPWGPLHTWMHAAPHAGFYNFYGSTEAFSVAVGRVERTYQEGDLLPVGKPFRQVKITFLDEHANEMDPLIGGEMLVSSPWVASGYHRDPARTAAAFPNCAAERGAVRRSYFTGDVGRLTPDGELQVLGRRDAQVKHHGYRMELGEVEAVLRGIPGWADGCALLDAAQDKLYCFWTGALTREELLCALKKKLPRAMIPECFVHLPELPHTATMKLDRAALAGRYFVKEN